MPRLLAHCWSGRTLKLKERMPSRERIANFTPEDDLPRANGKLSCFLLRKLGIAVTVEKLQCVESKIYLVSEHRQQLNFRLPIFDRIDSFTDQIVDGWRSVKMETHVAGCPYTTLSKRRPVRASSGRRSAPLNWRLRRDQLKTDARQTLQAVALPDLSRLEGIGQAQLRERFAALTAKQQRSGNTGRRSRERGRVRVDAGPWRPILMIAELRLQRQALAARRQALIILGHLYRIKGDIAHAIAAFERASGRRPTISTMNYSAGRRGP